MKKNTETSYFALPDKATNVQIRLLAGQMLRILVAVEDTRPDPELARLMDKCRATRIDQLGFNSAMQNRLAPFLTLGMLARATDEELMRFGRCVGRRTIKVVRAYLKNKDLEHDPKAPIGPREKHAIMSSGTGWTLGHPESRIMSKLTTVGELTRVTKGSACVHMRNILRMKEIDADVGELIQRIENRLALFRLGFAK